MAKDLPNQPRLSRYAPDRPTFCAKCGYPWASSQQATAYLRPAGTPGCPQCGSKTAGITDQRPQGAP